MKRTFNANDSTYIQYGFLIKMMNIRGFCFMVFYALFENIIFLSVKKIFEMFRMQNTLRCLLKHDRRVPGGI